PLNTALGTHHMAQKFKPGDIFGVPLPNDSMGIGQVLSLEPGALNSVGCVFFAAIASPSGLSGVIEPIAALLVTPDLLKSGAWPVKEGLIKPLSEQSGAFCDVLVACWLDRCAKSGEIAAFQRLFAFMSRTADAIVLSSRAAS